MTRREALVGAFAAGLGFGVVAPAARAAAGALPAQEIFQPLVASLSGDASAVSASWDRLTGRLDALPTDWRQEWVRIIEAAGVRGGDDPSAARQLVTSAYADPERRSEIQAALNLVDLVTAGPRPRTAAGDVYLEWLNA